MAAPTRAAAEGHHGPSSRLSAAYSRWCADTSIVKNVEERYELIL